jgi:hypothetical protein
MIKKWKVEYESYVDFLKWTEVFDTNDLQEVYDTICKKGKPLSFKPIFEQNYDLAS